MCIHIKMKTCTVSVISLHTVEAHACVCVYVCVLVCVPNHAISSVGSGTSSCCVRQHTAALTNTLTRTHATNNGTSACLTLPRIIQVNQNSSSSSNSNSKNKHANAYTHTCMAVTQTLARKKFTHMYVFTGMCTPMKIGGISIAHVYSLGQCQRHCQAHLHKIVR